VPAPYCGEYQKDYSGAPNVGTAFEVKKYSDCSSNCSANAECENWLLTVKKDGKKTCQLRGSVPTAATAETKSDADTWYWFGAKDCLQTKEIPAMPEDAEELSYKEICSGNQYDEETRQNNTWNVETCPSKSPMPHL
jgi:hypothetical protein